MMLLLGSLAAEAAKAWMTLDAGGEQADKARLLPQRGQDPDR